MTDRLAGKVAIITGGGRGIGRAIALAFAREGAKLALVARSPADLEETVGQVQAMGRAAVALPADVSDSHQVAGVVEQAVQQFGTVDVLVNCAGVLGPIGLLVENDVEQWTRTLHVNLVGTFLCCRAVLPVMMRQRRGKIINLSGGGAVRPRPRFSAYGASKAAVVRLTETLAEEVREFNIQVNAIAPGAVNTRMLDEVLEAGEAAGRDNLAQARRQADTGGDPPERAATLAVFLASEDSDGLTGKLISAIHDDWEEAARSSLIRESDAYTLRRIDTHTLQKLNPGWKIPPSQ